jgi:diguanylate cyclase (GGDEF)-like protein/PAS domain S-box-containing protein/putative nucleotidyltransferase with HDIG domain
MKRLSMTNKIAGILTTLSIIPILVAGWTGVLPSGDTELMERRISISEQLANSSAILLASHDFETIDNQIESLQKTGVRGIRIRRFDGLILYSSKLHESFWTTSRKASGLNDCVTVPVIRNSQHWADCEISFAPVEWWKRDWASYALLIGLGIALNGASFIVFLFRVLSVLDPNSAVPKRVRNTLDTIVGGVVVLDASGRIMLVNDSFSKATGIDSENLIGSRLESLPWKSLEEGSYPWDRVLLNRERVTGTKLYLQCGNNQVNCFVTNATPIFDTSDKMSGALLSFEDITEMEHQREQLMDTLEDLEFSREQIRRQNDALRELASRDALTGALNRRALFENLDALWQRSTSLKEPFVAIMMDVDHFKKLNDTHGHAAGDAVLRQLVQVVAKSIDTDHLLGRYGGEEFCLLLPNTRIEEGNRIAEHVRFTIETQMAKPYKVTASIGVSGTELEPSSFQMMLEQADQGLYAAKHGGRNAVKCWHPGLKAAEKANKPTLIQRPEAQLDDLHVSYQTVVALHAALSYKHPDTALHSQRVAEYSIEVARGILTFRELYLLEIGALLHDIGKIGVPDHVLLKPSKLDPLEWRLMETHSEIGVEIIESAFHCKELTDVLAYHHCRYDGTNQPETYPRGSDIPLAARIVGIADAYDAMVSDRVYRKGRSPQEAFVELRRCAGTQFDPDLVERFIATQQNEIHVQGKRSDKVFHRSAVHVGQELERVLCAFESKDVTELKCRLNTLRQSAEMCEMPAIMQLVDVLREVLAEVSSPDWDLLMPILQSLVDCCLLVQRSYLHELGTKPILLSESILGDDSTAVATNLPSSQLSLNNPENNLTSLPSSPVSV